MYLFHLNVSLIFPEACGFCFLCVTAKTMEIKNSAESYTMFFNMNHMVSLFQEGVSFGFSSGKSYSSSCPSTFYACVQQAATVIHFCGMIFLSGETRVGVHEVCLSLTCSKYLIKLEFSNAPRLNRWTSNNLKSSGFIGFICVVMTPALFSIV